MATKWNVFTNSLDMVNSVSGFINGPAISTDDAICRFDGTTGKIIQNSGSTLSDSDVLSTGELNLTTQLAVSYGGTGTNSLLIGSYLVGNGSGSVITLDGTAKGSIPVGDGTTTPSILLAGINGQVLSADSSEATGVKWTTIAGTGDVTAAAVLADNAIVRGDGGAKGVQDSGILIDDSDNLNLPTGSVLQINGVSTLAATTLGSAVVTSSLTTVGTIGTGVWEGTVVEEPFGGTGISAYSKGDILYSSATNVLSKLPIGTNGQVLSVSTDVPAWAAASGGSMPEIVVGGSAASHQVNTSTAFAPVSYRDFGNIEILVRSFDDTGPEYMQGFFRVPADLGAGGSNVTFEIVGSAATAVASKNVKFTFDFIEVADDGLMTGSYSGTQTWDNQSISGTPNDQDIISNTQTITSLGWTAGNMIYYRLYRSAATTTNLSGDYDVISFNIRIPQA